MKTNPVHFPDLAVLALWFGAVITPDAWAALPQRAFVSGIGSDANPCSLALPCRSFDVAITAVAVGGEVVALDSAGYGPINVNKSVSVIAPPGIHAAITAFPPVDGIDINAPAGVVVLRGLYVNAQGGADGIEIFAAQSVQIENCVVNGFAGAGIQVNSDSATVNIVDSIVRNNGTHGIRVNPPTMVATVTLDRVRIENNALGGFVAIRNARAAINDSVAANNGTEGFYAGSNTRVTVRSSVSNNNGVGFQAMALLSDVIPTEMSIDGSIASNNATGVLAGNLVFPNGPVVMMLANSLVTGNSDAGLATQAAGLTMRVSNTTITRNENGIVVNGGSILSRGNNTVADNTNPGAFSGTFLPQ